MATKLTNGRLSSALTDLLKVNLEELPCLSEWCT